MVFSTKAFAAATFATLALPCVLGAPKIPRTVLSPDSVCGKISSAVSSASDVYVLGTINYATDLQHWAVSSSQSSECTVEPGTPEDIATILQILGNNSHPFAVKGGGHASNPGFSSTTGVHISMTRFDDVVYDAASGTATFGSGLVWDDVYSALVPLGVNVVGGRVTNVGVAGFTLGGGLSWKSNQYGLTIDTITKYELVLPTGTVKNVTETSDPDLFWALKGGFNNFGIVTRFTLKTFPQTDVWGGLITFTVDQMDKVVNATMNFAAKNTDPKAAIITTMNSISGLIVGLPGISQLLFYDGPTPPDGIFDEFLAIPHFSEDVSTRDFVSLVQSSPSDATAGTRGVFHTVGVTDYSDTFLEIVKNETIFWGNDLVLQSGLFISYDLEPFLESAFTKASVSSSAWPPVRRKMYPTNLYYAWSSELADDVMHSAIKQSQQRLLAAAEAEGQNVAGLPLYGNYAIFDSDLEDIYGSNLAKMKAVKARVDPKNVMGLAGGWKITV
ncbi:FAD-binding domain-containing protein [Punctularia strigosozonata HHB-11173 SS5]|uniref:FAD-binding domain-containing protein n=1 Tax=Punctularia strigosozonata (strain HHB-11173) TaxID=741275 RepID=UPI0004417031|nr:FAD-binding domain-containing protein [Punctularia strigosozonata HHB-11173 SS5]EIN08932.1 FAD-binding domain-containing protein [Punctularia strigosozonata HHB-11173 SS5]